MKLKNLLAFTKSPYARVTPDSFNGLNDQLGLVDAPLEQKVRVENGVVKIGNIKLDDFNALSTTKKFEFLNDPTIFDANVRAKISEAIDFNFVDANQKAKALEQGDATLQKAKTDLVDANGNVKTTGSKWDSLVTSLKKIPYFKAIAAGVFITQLAQLLDENSGCFLEGPDGESIRMGGDITCDCNNPELKTACCTQCKFNNPHLICPGDEPNDVWTEPYVCPSAPASSSSLKSRVSMSVATAAAMQRAKALAAAAPTKPLSNILIDEGPKCTSCGCEGWFLCTRETSLFGLIADAIASVGKVLKEGVDGLFNLADAALDTLLTPLKTILMVVGMIIGVGVAIGVTIVTVRVVKKKKKRLQNG